MADVFLSYSRRDSEFVSRLASALEQRGKEVWVDVEGVRDAEVFPEALRRAIESSDAFAFVISPDAVKSSFCVEEIEHAARLNKRIVPLALRPVPDEELPEEVRFRNWIPAGGDGELREVVERVVRALDTDLEWEREHSRLTVRALEWDRSGRDRSFLLRGSELTSAEEWLAAGAEKDPGPTALETEYVVAARRSAVRRQRGLVATSLVVAAVSVALLIFALISRSAAISQALTSDAERVGAQALVVPDLDRAMLYAVAGVKLQDNQETRGDLLTLLQKNYAAIRVIRPSHDEITALAVDPRADLLAIGDSAGVVRFESMSSWRQSGPPLRLGGAVGPQAVAFSPRGNSLAVVTTRTARSNLYTVDLATRRARLLSSWPGLVPMSPIQGVSFAYDPSGRRIALALSTAIPGGGPPLPKSLSLLDASTGRRIWQRAYPGGPGQQKARVQFAPDGTLLTSTQQGDTLLWNVRTGRVVRRFAVGGEPALSADGKTLALALNTPNPANPSSRIALLDTRTGRYRLLPAGVPSSWIKSLAFTPDGSQVVGGDFSGNVFVWNTATGAISEQFAGPSANGTGAVILDPTGRTILTGAEDGSVTVLDLAGQRRLGRSFQWNTPAQSCGFPPCIVVTRQGDLMATDQGDGSVALIDLRTLRPAATLPARNGAIANAIAFFPDGNQLLTGGVNGHLTVWDVRSRHIVRTIYVGQPVWWGAVSPDGRLIAVQTHAPGSSISEVQARPVSGNKPLWTRRVQDGYGGLYFSPDGREVAALGCCTPESTVVSWASRSGKQLFSRRLASHASAIAYSPDSRLLAVGTQNGQVLFWGPRTGTAQAPALHVAAGIVEQIAFAPNGKLFAVSSNDLTTTLWSLGSRKELGGSFPGSPGAAPVEAFEPNGRLLIDYLSNAFEWPTDVRTWERFACQVAGRNLTQAEWHDVLPNRPYMRICPR